MMSLQDRLNEVRKALLRNGYLLERSQDEATRIHHAGELLKNRLIQDRDRQASAVTSGEPAGDEYLASVRELGRLRG